MGLDLIWWGVVRFDSIWFDAISCDSICCVLCWLNVICSWFDSRDLVSFDLMRCYSTMLFNSIWFGSFCLNAIWFKSWLSNWLADSSEFKLFWLHSWFNLIWFDSMWSDSSLTWFVLTWFYEFGVDSISFCLMQVSSMLVDLIRFECWWFYSIWFALIWFDLIRLTFCEDMYVSAMCLHFQMLYRISYLLAVSHGTLG